jgi:hypothetical protein
MCHFKKRALLEMPQKNPGAQQGFHLLWYNQINGDTQTKI